jgi:predicted ArsR family transcriptional regulator
VTRKDFEAEVLSVAALGDPIRRKLYEYVVNEPLPVSRDQAAQHVGVARHVAKFHLDKLEDEGLLEVEFNRPSGRRGPGAGRPTKFYLRSSREITVTLPERHYDFASRLLAQAITVSAREERPVSDALHESANSFGQTSAVEAKSHLGKRPSQQKVIEAIFQLLSERGYEPRGDADGITLANCPFHSLAQEYTTLVCGMNKDFIQGLLKELPTKLRAELNPKLGRCCVTLVKPDPHSTV